MRKLLTTAILALSLASLPACYNATIIVADGPGVRSPLVDHDMHANLFNILEFSAIDMAKGCPTGVVAIQERVSFFGGVINTILGRYLPVLSVSNPSLDCRPAA